MKKFIGIILLMALLMPNLAIRTPAFTSAQEIITPTPPPQTEVATPDPNAPWKQTAAAWKPTLESIQTAIAATSTAAAPQRSNRGNKIQGVFAYWSDVGSYYNTFRFYEDGLVLNVSLGVSDLCASWPDIDQWFQRSNQDISFSIGNYTLDHNWIEFELESSGGVVAYEGYRGQDKLVLNIFSQINDFRAFGRIYELLDCESLEESPN